MQAGACREWVRRVRHAPRTATAVIAFAFATDFCLLLMLVPILPLMKDELGIDDEELGFLFSLKPLATLLANPFMGVICDRTGARVPMFAALVILSVSTSIFAFSNAFGLLCVARALQGVASSGNIVAGMAHLSQVFSAEGGGVAAAATDGDAAAKRGAEIGKALMGISIGVMVGAPLGGFLFELGGRQAPFLFLAGLLAIDAAARILLLAEPSEVRAYRDQQSVAAEPGKIELQVSVPLKDAAAAAAVAVVGDEDTDGRPASAGSGDDAAPTESTTTVGADDVKIVSVGALEAYRRLVCDAPIMAIAGVVFFGNGAISMIEVFLPLYLSGSLDQGRIAIGLIYGAETMLYTCCVPFLGKKGAGWGRHNILTAGVFIMGVTILLMPAVQDLAWFMPCWMCSGIGMACIDSSASPALADIVDVRHKGSYGKAFAVVQTGNSLGFITGPIVGGLLKQAGGFAHVTSIFGACLVAFTPVVPAVFYDLAARVRRLCGGGRQHVRLVESDGPPRDAAPDSPRAGANNE